MSQQGGTSTAHSRGGDGWTAFSYPVGGVVVYGGLGWLLDRWWGTSSVVAVGVLLGLALGLYLVYARFWHFPEPPAPSVGPTSGRVRPLAGATKGDAA